jgi:hypothetical protein
MENEKLQVNFAPGTAYGELTIREGEAPKLLDPKPPVKSNLKGVIGAVSEYLAKRVMTGQFKQERSHLLVNREEIKMTLVVNENDEYQSDTIEGKLEFHPAFVAFGINADKVWTPTELGMFIKMHRAFFPDRTANMSLVTELMNFTAQVQNKIDRSVKENGDRTDNFAQVVNSNLPASFTLRIPIFKGMDAETLEVETFAKINGREVAFALLSPGAQETLETLRDEVIDKELDKVRVIAPDIAIIEQ